MGKIRDREGRVTRFTRIPVEVLEDPALTPVAKMTYWALAHHADDHGECFPSIPRIMKLLGMKTRRLVWTAIRLLEQERYIRVKRERGEPNSYLLVSTGYFKDPTKHDTRYFKDPGVGTLKTLPPGTLKTPELYPSELDTRTRGEIQIEDPKIRAILNRAIKRGEAGKG